MEITNEIIEIKPKKEYLSAADLTRVRHAEVENFKLGLKRTTPNETAEEAEILHKLYDNLRQQLSVPHIERLGGRALATWDEEEQAVRVLRKDGKFQSYGYSQNGQYYLEYFEALFLLELGRLQLEYHDMVMSIEQAYLLLLGEESTYKYNEYLVYSHLSRVGYILVKHQNISYEKPPVEINEMDCIWALLLNAVQNKDVPNYIKTSERFEKIKNNMEQIKKETVEHKYEADSDLTNNTEIHFDAKVTTPSTAKRKTENTDITQSTKRLCTAAATSTSGRSSSFLNFLKNEPEYKQFQEIFETFDFVHLKSYANADFDDCTRDLKINFDLYVHNAGFKKSTPGAPIFRVVIINANETFPSHIEISKCHHKQKYAAPILIVAVNESKQIQAFLYYFS